MSYDNWKKRLEIAKLPTVAARRAELSRLKLANMEPTVEDEGYYRKPVTQPTLGADGKTNGRKTVVDWIPVAYFKVDGMHGEALAGVIGAGDDIRDMTVDEVSGESIWSWCSQHPISYETYVAVAENGEPWPDVRNRLIDEPAVPAANREVAKTDNAPPAAEVLPLDVQHAIAIDNAIGAAPKTVTSEAEDALASGSKNRIAELRLAADKAGRAIYEPMHRVYVAEQKKWSAPVKRAETKEKELNTAILTFRESERKKAAAAAAEAARLQEEQDEANERAAQRAIARGEPEMPPPPAEAAPVLPPAPAPVQPTYGTRQVKAEPKLFIQSVDDWDLLFRHFRDNREVRIELTKLALVAARNGVTVPGITTVEALIAPDLKL